MAKFVFDSISEFKTYIEKWFSKRRKRNPDGYSFEWIKTDLRGEIAYIYFKTSAKGRVLAMAIRIPAKNKWLGFMPTFEHEAMIEMIARLSEVNNYNHGVNPNKQMSTDELRKEYSDEID